MRGQVRGRGAAERVAFEHGDVHADRLQHAETTLGDPLGPQTLGGLPHISGEEGGRVGAVLPYTPDQSACGISRHTELPARAAFCARADKKFLVRPPLVVVVVPLVHPKIAHTKAMVEDKKDFGLNQSDPDPTQTPPRPEVWGGERWQYWWCCEVARTHRMGNPSLLGMTSAPKGRECAVLVSPHHKLLAPSQQEGWVRVGRVEHPLVRLWVAGGGWREVG